MTHHDIRKTSLTTWAKRFSSNASLYHKKMFDVILTEALVYKEIDAEVYNKLIAMMKGPSKDDWIMAVVVLKQKWKEKYG